MLKSVWDQNPKLSRFTHSLTHSQAVSSVPRNFISGRDGIFAKSRDPGIFRDGICLIFLSRDFLEIVRDFSGYFCLMRLVINLNIFHEQESPTCFQRGWKCCDQEEKSPGPWESGELCDCEDEPLAFEGDGIPKINIFDKYLFDWTLGLWPFFLH